MFWQRYVMKLAGISFLVLSAAAQTLTLQDGTPVRLRLNRSVSSSTARVGEIVDFEVTEPVIVNSVAVIPKGALALGKVTKAGQKRRFGRAGELEISVDSIRLADGGSIPLRATHEKGEGDMSGARVAATIAASPVLVWVKGKDVAFDKGTETSAYVSGDVHIDERQLRGGSTSTAADSADRETGTRLMTNADVIQMQRAGLSEEIVLTKIRTGETSFATNPQDLIQLKEAGVSDPVINLMVQKSGR
jgi:hypothetical protein